MSNIVVIGDSSCDYSPEQADAAGFSMVPLTVRFGEEQFLEGLELTPAQFYRRLAKSDVMPKTSQPSPEMFMSVFKKYSDADHIICVTISSGLSGTVRSASLAKSLLEEQGFAPSIHVIDSCNGCTATGLFCEVAARMAREGADIAEILERMDTMKHTSAIYFVPDTLEYLRRGGRIGNIRAAVGSLLGIKPIITVVGGLATDAGKCRGTEQVKKKLIQKFLESAKNIQEVTIIHTDAAARAADMAHDLKSAVNGIKIQFHAVGSVIGSYIGAGAIGLSFEEKAARW